MLFLAGGADHLLLATLNRANYRCCRHSGSITDYHELPAGRSHALLGQPIWREDAALVLRWLKRLGLGEVHERVGCEGLI